MSSRRNTAHELDEAALRELLQQYMKHAPPRRIDLAVEEIIRSNTHVITESDVAYPASLDKLGDLRPPILFCRGNLDLFDSRIVAIVGTRRSTEYGNEAAEMIAHDLASRGITIISGLALGIDSFAHAGAFGAEGNTIAVLGCGIDVYYPHRNARLQDRIAEEGLLISEFAPGDPAVKYHFLQRNRLIAVLASAVVVVEAGSRSGTRNTVGWALEYGIDVFAVPGPIGREASIGTNELIQDGAVMITSSTDLMRRLPWRLNDEPVAEAREDAVPAHLSSDEASVYKVLGSTGMHIDKIARAVGIGSREAAVLLAEMEIAGAVRQVGGMRFARVKAPKPKGGVPPKFRC